MKSQILRGDSPILELDRWNFQQVLDLGFPETSQSLSSFKQLLFSSFHRGDQRNKIKKNWIPPKILALHFLIGIPFFIIWNSSLLSGTILKYFSEFWISFLFIKGRFLIIFKILLSFERQDWILFYNFEFLPCL